MVKTKGIERSVGNWKSGVAGASGRYTEGVKATTNFKEASLAGDESYKSAIQNSIALDLRRKGVEKMDPSKWQNNTATKGTLRWAPGVNAAEADYRKGLGPVLSVIEGVTLPPRTNDASTNVQSRVTPIAVALQQAKREGRL